MVGPAAKRLAVAELVTGFAVSERRACRLISLQRSTNRYVAKPNDDAVILERMREIAKERPRAGCPMMHMILRREGLVVNHKRTQRIYRVNKMQLTHRNVRRRVRMPSRQVASANALNERWSMDFMHDTLFISFAR